MFYVKIASQVLIGPLSRGVTREDNASANAPVESTSAVVRYTAIFHVQIETTPYITCICGGKNTIIILEINKSLIVICLLFLWVLMFDIGCERSVQLAVHTLLV